MNGEASRRPVLVTGAHRAGTTWVGRMLCASGELAYVHEPFNIEQPAPWLSPPMPHWYQYVSAENEGPHVAPMARVLALRFPVPRPTQIRSAAQLRSTVKRAALSARDRACRRRPLLKDPIALLSAAWLAERFRAQPIVVVRHPAAFASSIARLDWRFDFRNWLDQPLLMRDLLGPFEREVRAAADGALDPLDQAIVMWRVLYGVVHRFRGEHPEWCFVRHEDLAVDPVTGFAQLAERVGLRFDDRARAVVASHSSDRHRSGATERGRHDIRRNSRAAAKTWSTRLTAAELARVRDGVGDVAVHFYADESWLPSRAF